MSVKRHATYKKIELVLSLAPSPSSLSVYTYMCLIGVCMFVVQYYAVIKIYNINLIFLIWFY